MGQKKLLILLNHFTNFFFTQPTSMISQQFIHSSRIRFSVTVNISTIIEYYYFYLVIEHVYLLKKNKTKKQKTSMFTINPRLFGPNFRPKTADSPLLNPTDMHASVRSCYHSVCHPIINHSLHPKNPIF